MLFKIDFRSLNLHTSSECVIHLSSINALMTFILFDLISNTTSLNIDISFICRDNFFANVFSFVVLIFHSSILAICRIYITFCRSFNLLNSFCGRMLGFLFGLSLCVFYCCCCYFFPFIVEFFYAILGLFRYIRNSKL